jgi:hypothetical protein
MPWVSPQHAVLKGQPYVLDVGLSLAPTGLYWALALAHEGPVWVPHCHWSIVLDKEFPISAGLATYLAGVANVDEATAILGRVRNEWREALDRIGLESLPNFFWPMDGRLDSVVPKDGDATLVDRVHILAAGLDSRLGNGAEGGNGGADALCDCARDTLALAAALGDRRPVVLSRLARDEPAPLLLERLKKADVPCAKLTAPRLLEAVHASLCPAMLGSGLAVPLASGGLRLAALLVVAPGALNAGILSAMMADDDLEWHPDAHGCEAALWNDAAAIWWEVC